MTVLFVILPIVINFVPFLDGVAFKFRERRISYVFGHAVNPTFNISHPWYDNSDRKDTQWTRIYKNSYTTDDILL